MTEAVDFDEQYKALDYLTMDVNHMISIIEEILASDSWSVNLTVYLNHLNALLDRAFDLGCRWRPADNSTVISLSIWNYCEWLDNSVVKDIIDRIDDARKLLKDVIKASNTTTTISSV